MHIGSKFQAKAVGSLYAGVEAVSLKNRQLDETIPDDTIWSSRFALGLHVACILHAKAALCGTERRPSARVFMQSQNALQATSAVCNHDGQEAIHRVVLEDFPHEC